MEYTANTKQAGSSFMGGVANDEYPHEKDEDSFQQDFQKSTNQH